jgi:hypothetical protein
VLLSTSRRRRSTVCLSVQTPCSLSLPIRRCFLFEKPNGFEAAPAPEMQLQ